MLNILQKFVNSHKSWYNHILINYEWSGYDNLKLCWYSEIFVLPPNKMALSIAILDTFQVKFLHRREVVAKKLNMYPFVHTKNLSIIHFYRNFVPFGCSESIGWSLTWPKHRKRMSSCIVEMPTDNIFQTHIHTHTHICSVV